MHLIGITLVNWTRFRGEHELELGPGVYAVTAEYEDDPRRSNAAGKTALLSAIRWAIDGVRVLDKDNLDELITHGEAEAEVALEFSNGLFVSRLKKRGQSAQLLVAHPDGRELTQSGAQAELDNLINLSEDDRLSTCLVDQGEVGAMVRQRAGAVTAQFESWVGTEKIEDAGKFVSAWLSEAVARNERARFALRAIEDAIERLPHLEADVTRLEAECAAVDVAARRAAQQREQHAERRALAETVAEAGKLHLDLAQPNPVAPSSEKRDEAKTARDSAIVHERALGERVGQLRKLARGDGFDGVCPVSPGFECPARAQINARTEANKASFAKAEREHVAAQSARRTAEQQHEKLERLASEAVLAASTCQHRKIRLAELHARMLAAGSLQPLPLGPNGRYPDPPAHAPTADRTELGRAIAALDAAKEASAGLEAARQELEDAAWVARAHRLAARVLGPEGARRRAVEGVVAQIADQATVELSRIGTDLAVEAAWDREVGEPATHCTDCATAFPKTARAKTCERCGAARGKKTKNEFRFRPSAVSGGTRDLAGLAVRCAAFRWLRERRDSPWSIACLDEPLAQLDAHHRDAVSVAIQRLLAGTFDQTFVTAHHQGVLSAMPNRILIKGYGRWSKLETT